MSDQLPILYSFRRCPYAMRARLALAYAQVPVEIREIELGDKPAEMLAISPKGTVPVLQLADGTVIDESLDVMRRALDQYDPEEWQGIQKNLTAELILANDTSFKKNLDRYKYHSEKSEHPKEHYRGLAVEFLQHLERCLACRRIVSAEEQAQPSYKKGVSCPHCINESSPEQRARFAERAKQFELAAKRGQRHIGVPFKNSTQKKKS